MINIVELIEKEMLCGYSEGNASSKVCQDLMLFALSKSSIKDNVTIKGGVVMRSKSKNIRRATQDLDIDMIRYSISNDALDSVIKQMNCYDDLKIKRVDKIQDLKQGEYRGKRVYIQIKDTFGHTLNSKIDIGVHKELQIEQEEFCFDISFNNEGVSLMINSNEQMLVEKLKSLLKLGPFSTRYKDVFDMYYLIHHIKIDKLLAYITISIFDDKNMREKSIEDIIKRLQFTFGNRMYLSNIKTSKKNWIEENIEDVLIKLISFFELLEY